MVIDIEMGVSSVLIIDTMSVVNMVTETLEMTNAMHFAKKCVAIVAKMNKTNYEEIRIVFYQYVSNSLKETTRDKRTAIQHRSTTMYMMVLKLGMSRLFFPTSKQKQSLKKLTILPRETTESLDNASYSDGG